MIRKAAGLGRLSGEADPDHYDKGYLHCDLLVIAVGGLMATLTAAKTGLKVILADEDFRLAADECGTAEIDGMSSATLLPKHSVYWARRIMCGY